MAVALVLSRVRVCFVSFEGPAAMTNDKVSADKAMTGIMTHSSVWEFQKSQMVDSFQQLVG